MKTEKTKKDVSNNVVAKNNGFGIISVIIIIVITALVSGVATGVIVMNNYKDVSIKNVNLSDDKNLQEFVDLYGTILSKYYDEVDKEGMIKAAQEGMINFLDDKYTTFLSDAEYNSIIEGLASDYKGIGVTISNNVIEKVSANSPAEKAGLLEGDIIVSVNNTNVESFSSAEISSMIKNNDIKTVSLVIRRNDILTNYTIEKSNIEYPYVSSKLIDNTTIGYLSISAFSTNLASQVESELKKIEGSNISGLIIDLRNNGGGYLNSVTETASIFLDKGSTIFHLSSTSGKKVVKDETDESRKYPIVVIMNKQTASAAEILAASLKQSYNAVLVGTQSFGKGKVQQISSLASGDTVKYTTAEWLTPNGVCIDGVGLNADHFVELTYKYNENNEIIGYEDSQLDKAIELLK